MRYLERFVKMGERKRRRDVERIIAKYDVDEMCDAIRGKSNVDKSSEREDEQDDSVLACVAIVCEDHDSGCEVITVPRYVQEEDASSVRVKEELRTDQTVGLFTDVPGRCYFAHK